MLVASSVTGHILKHSEIELNLLMHGLWLVWFPYHNFVPFFYIDLLLYRPAPVLARSKAWVFGRSFAGTVSSNPARRGNGCMSVLFVVCCQVAFSGSG